MLKFKRKKIYKEFNLDKKQIAMCEKIYKFHKKNGFYYQPTLRHNKTLFTKVLKKFYRSCI